MKSNKPASACNVSRVSRSGETPGPTVKVRMGENQRLPAQFCVELRWYCGVAAALNGTSLIVSLRFHPPSFSPDIMVLFYNKREFRMNEVSISKFGNPAERVNRAIEALVSGKGVLLVDDEDRENEGDLIFPAEAITEAQMAILIRECSGIVCLCLPPEKVKKLGLPQMVGTNTSAYQTAFTISIEAAIGVTTGVSAADRATTIRCAAAPDASGADIHSPGHVFPLRASENGVFERRGHTEGTVDLMRLAGLCPAGVLCELTNPDGTMAKLPQIITFADAHDFPVLSIEDIFAYRTRSLDKSA